jgi:hypothetical protein
MGFLDELFSRLKQFKKMWDDAGPAGGNGQPPVVSQGFPDMPDEDPESAMEDIYRDTGTKIKATRFQTVKKGETLRVKVETQRITRGGGAEIEETTTVPIESSGKRMRGQDDIAGFCAICEENVSHENARFCAGYGGFPCNKLLCARHAISFTDDNGEVFPCCQEHYRLREAFRKNAPAFEPREKKGRKEDG